MVVTMRGGAPVCGAGFPHLLLPGGHCPRRRQEPSGEVANPAGEEVPTRLVTLGPSTKPTRSDVLFAQSRGELYLALRGPNPRAPPPNAA